MGGVKREKYWRPAWAARHGGVWRRQAAGWDQQTLSAVQQRKQAEKTMTKTNEQ
jgi:hypothetical protein